MNLVSQLQPDLVMLDIDMPLLSGDALAKLLRANADTGHIRIVFYSSNDEESLRECVSICGVHGYIGKGDIANLCHQVDRFLGMPCC